MSSAESRCLLAAPQFRGTFNQLFQLFLTLFILIAQVINLIMHVTGAENSWGFRLSLGFAFVPAFMLFMAGTFLPDSPNSLLERGYITQVSSRSFEAIDSAATYLCKPLPSSTTAELTKMAVSLAFCTARLCCSMALVLMWPEIMEMTDHWSIKTVRIA